MKRSNERKKLKYLKRLAMQAAIFSCEYPDLDIVPLEDYLDNQIWKLKNYDPVNAMPRSDAIFFNDNYPF